MINLRTASLTSFITFIKCAGMLAIGSTFAGCSPGTTRIVLIPDTQTYAEKYPEVLMSQTDWVNKNAGKIDLVLQQGDLTQNNSEKEWSIVKAAFGRIPKSIPLLLAAGNHDMGSAPGKFADNRNTALYNAYFPVSYFQEFKGSAGYFEANRSENLYRIFRAQRVKWLVLSLEFGPRNSVLQWADSVVKAHPNHIVIVNTHSYMYSDDTRQGLGDNWRAHGYGVGKLDASDPVNDGEEIWQKLIKDNSNIRFVFSGHILNDGTGLLISQNAANRSVYQMLSNYQEGVKGSVKGGNGWLRILTLDHRGQTLMVETYSPYTNSYNREPAHNFTLNNVMLK